ncbi:MAG: hypothetical protein S4CHLAM6_09780 [Chlamydiae bacterium]|nr:hypothetical protein [Chlamydiota bacterium]
MQVSLQQPSLNSIGNFTKNNFQSVSAELEEHCKKQYLSNAVFHFPFEEKIYAVRIIANPNFESINMGNFSTTNFPIIIAPKGPFPEELQNHIKSLVGTNKILYAGGTINGQSGYNLFENV